MKISFVAGFGPIVRDPQESHKFWADGLGIEFGELSPGYFATDNVEGVKHFGLWPLAEAAENTFGTPDRNRLHAVDARRGRRAAVI
ncbi:MAG: hypothetical protein ABI797_01105 [Chloroflexota bacterium]